MHSNVCGLTAATTTSVKDFFGETMGQSHQISDISISPDNKLWVHMADGFQAFKAQDLNSFKGKILRMNLDGTAPSDNPFYTGANGARDYIYAYGFRNPFGGAWRAADGAHYSVENGGAKNDRFAKIIRGHNFKWDGPEFGFNDNFLLDNAIYNWDPPHAPVDLAFIEPETFNGSGFPQSMMDHAFVTESGPTYGSGPQTQGKRITEFVLGTTGDVPALQAAPAPFVEYNGNGKATAAAIAAGPDGLYFSDLYKDVDFDSPIAGGAHILRVSAGGGVDSIAAVTAGPPPLTVQFTDASSVVQPTAWFWEFGDGGTSNTLNPQHTYTQDGTYTVRLSVTGSNGVKVTEKVAFIRVGVLPKIALIGGGSAPSSAEVNLVSHLNAAGYIVDTFDDEPGNRPTAATLASLYDLVIASSTIISSNVAGEFAAQPVPLIYWEPALNSTTREALAEVGNVHVHNSINVINNTHPVTQGLPTGDVTVFNGSRDTGTAQGPYGAGVRVLATLTGNGGQATIMTAEQGAALLAGRTAPARRVFLYHYDAGWLSSTAFGKQIMDQAVQWALTPPVFVSADFDSDIDVDGDDFTHLINCMTGPAIGPLPPGCEDADLDLDGDVDLTDFGRFQRCLSGTDVAPDPACEG